MSFATPQQVTLLILTPAPGNWETALGNTLQPIWTMRPGDQPEAGEVVVEVNHPTKTVTVRPRE